MDPHFGEGKVVTEGHSWIV